MGVLLKVEGISKFFPGVRALDDVNLTINEGEIHGVIGENGAGKSTIIKILAGVYKPDSGKITFMEKEFSSMDISDSLSCGISVIYQELCLVPDMTVYENIVLGFEQGKNFYSAKESRKKAERISKELELDLPLDRNVRDLDIAVQQMVEIAKALSRNSKLIIMDEPTSSLTDKEIKILYRIIRSLKKQNIAVLFVSHKLDEVIEICDNLTILRDGKCITTKKVGEITENEMVFDMVGRKINNYYTLTHVSSKEVICEVKNLSKTNVIDDINFKLHKGEVLGMTGLVGAGRTETVQILFGLDTFEKGEFILEGKSVQFQNPREAVKAGIAMVPENRKDQGIFPQMSVGFNISISILKDFIKFSRVNPIKEEEIINKYMNALSVKASSSMQSIGNLSGGNQQKAIFARWLATNPKVLILDEPTKGIDIGAKTEIYKLIDELAKTGVAILLISSELPEIINVSDRILVMSKGKIAATLNDKSEFSQENIMKYCLGVNK